ncbi:hypothetical protein HGP14_31090 [Rhizobium sp. P32RR-XVIII]|uniref:hypothetical protein n=1 Tax=Rhizobium sp. P32RR-XVIII TaxID=2726738 RepID=UPI001456F7B8|nr:hypothetical protein [Rhizobium sp. P32RR-XVIII]NLS07702.1 hypothetical protein [Rhizobium sp. P32RR-XVIII]
MSAWLHGSARRQRRCLEADEIGSTILFSSQQLWVGEALFLSAFFFGRRIPVTLRRSGLMPLHGAAVVAFWSALLFLPIYLLVPMPRGIVEASYGSIAFAVFFQGILTSVVSLIAFNRAVAMLGASSGAVFA